MVVLFYHRLGSPRQPNPELYVRPETFEKQVKYLCKKYNVITLKEFIGILRNKAHPKDDCVVLTFDDGWEDNYSILYPILRKYNLPAAIFITTGLIDKKDMLTWGQIKEMSSDGITFGAHTVTHPRLTKIDLEAAKKEIRRSKVDLENRIGKKVAHFAYPFGKENDFDENIVKILKDLNFQCAFSTINGENAPGNDFFSLRRNGVGNFTIPAFAARVSGVFELYPFISIRRLIGAL